MERGRRLALFFVLLPWIASLPSCAVFCPIFCPHDEPKITDFSLVTPEATFKTFQDALEEGNSWFEYKCLSNQLLEELDADYQAYQIGRAHFMKKYKKEVRRFLASKIAGPPEVFRTMAFADPEDPDHPGHELARLTLTDGEGEAEFTLINEPYWEVEARIPGEEPYVPDFDQPIRDLEEVLSLDGRTLRIEIEFAGRPPRLDEIAGLTLKDEWKVLDFLTLRENFNEDTSKGQNGESEDVQP